MNLSFNNFSLYPMKRQTEEVKTIGRFSEDMHSKKKTFVRKQRKSSWFNLLLKEKKIPILKVQRKTVASFTHKELKDSSQMSFFFFWEGNLYQIYHQAIWFWSFFVKRRELGCHIGVNISIKLHQDVSEHFQIHLYFNNGSVIDQLLCTNNPIKNTLWINNLAQLQTCILFKQTNGNIRCQAAYFVF